ncbi:ABC transporter permease [Sulfitobacter sp. G21635-S1]|uniref:ABC transporter permease n=1 Tax=Sulfitobacter sp. G21635-S1 TaxID=3014043 RepID=UPI0022B02D8A|nr:ABC transporter permease [Sulfitobacter sp. G21635-S1]MCZ4256652.1 ABC transporter permease [Sulfitobacter sp. G21635-S1]
MNKSRHGYIVQIASNRLAQVGFALILLVAAIAFIGPLVSPHTHSEFVGAPYGLPTEGAPLGTDNLGRDVLSRVMHGGQDLVWMAFCATLLGLALGTAMGLSAAFFKGWTETVLMRVVELKLAFPSIVFALLFVTMLGPGKGLLTIVVGVSQAPSVARVMRGVAMDVVRQEYVQWARSVGMRAWRVLWAEVLPNTTSPLLVEFGLRMMWSISLLAGLSFLGYGIQPPAADWGLMVNENRNALSVQPFAVLAPIVLIALFSIGCNLFAEGVTRAIGRTGGTE